MDVRIQGNEAKDHINAYLEYRRVVGDADGGVLMSQREYNRYKEKLKREGKYHEEPLQGHVPRQARKMTEQEEMAFYEKRYQERRKRERELARRRGHDQSSAGGGGRGAAVGAVMANGIPMAIQDLYQQLELEGGEGGSNDFVLPWDRALQDS